MEETRMAEAEAVANIVQELHTPKVLEFAGDGIKGAGLVLPKGMTVQSVKPFLDENRETPERRKGTARLVTLAALIDHANRFKDKDSALFANPQGTPPMLQAVLDYHSPDGPRWGQHRGVYSFPVSEEWEAWQAAEKAGLMEIGTFAELIEDRIGDVIAPASQTAKDFAEQHGCELASTQRLLELSRGLSVMIGAKVTDSRNLQTGEAHVTFQEEHTDASGAPIRVPGAFMIGIPVFRGGDRYQIPVRLRYRVRQGAIFWSVSLYRTDKAFELAFNEAADKAAEETGLPLFYGTPE